MSQSHAHIHGPAATHETGGPPSGGATARKKEQNKRRAFTPRGPGFDSEPRSIRRATFAVVGSLVVATALNVVLPSSPFKSVGAPGPQSSEAYADEERVGRQNAARTHTAGDGVPRCPRLTSKQAGEDVAFRAYHHDNGRLANSRKHARSRTNACTGSKARDTDAHAQTHADNNRATHRGTRVVRHANRERKLRADGPSSEATSAPRGRRAVASGTTPRAGCSASSAPSRASPTASCPPRSRNLRGAKNSPGTTPISTWAARGWLEASERASPSLCSSGKGARVRLLQRLQTSVVEGKPTVAMLGPIAGAPEFAKSIFVAAFLFYSIRLTLADFSPQSYEVSTAVAVVTS